MPSPRVLIPVLALGLWLSCPHKASADFIANSVTEFSGVQGRDNWYYGYYQGTFTPTSFQLMQIFSPASLPNSWTVDFDQPPPQYWTFLNADGGSPNGIITSGGRTQVEQWAVRRWISEVNGPITITGQIADADSGGGNGIIGHIFIGGVEVYNASINNGDLAGVNYSIAANVSVGTPIDFAIDPKAANDLADSTRFTALVQTASVLSPVPAPSGLVLVLSAVFALLVRWRGPCFSNQCKT